MIYDIVIVGAGPAGVTAAVQLKRAGYSILLIEKKRVGGLVANANLIENYSGFPEGISGIKFALLLKKYMKKYRIPLSIAEVKNIQKKGKIFIISTDNLRLHSKAVVIATGTSAKRIKVEGETVLENKRLFYEINNLPSLYSKTEVSIIGGGDVAFDYALNLAKNRKINRINIIMRNKPDCISILLKRATKNRKINILLSSIIKKFVMENNKIKLVLIGKPTKILYQDYIVVAIGREHNIKFLSLDWQRRLHKNPHALEDGGLCLAGDVNAQNMRYVAVAVAEALRASTIVGRFLYGY